MNKCTGCGAKLQNINKNEIGYINSIDDTLCKRCFDLKNYNKYQETKLTNVEFKEIINNIPNSSLVLYVSDLLSLNTDMLNDLNNVILVLTKRDILPKSLKDKKIIDKLKKVYSNLLDIVIISSIKNYEIDTLLSKIEKYRHSKNVYIVGNTNAGKSTLINRLIKNYENYNANITESMYPSTTLGQIEIKFKDYKLIDTPGIIDAGNIINYIDYELIKKINPKKEIKPKSCQLERNGSLLIDSLVRIDYKIKEKGSMVIYTSNNIEKKFISSNNNILKDNKAYSFTVSDGKDIVIPGLGFIKVCSNIEVEIYPISGTIPYIRTSLI